MSYVNGKFKSLLLGMIWVTTTQSICDSAENPKRAIDPACVVNLCVGPSHKLRKPSEAALIAKNGQTILIEAAEYHGDIAYWPQDNLTIRGVNGRAHLVADGASFGGKGTWVISGSDSIVENIEFSGAKVPDQNGAGIRFEGKNITIRNCYFHNNENGILSGANKDSQILIENSEFANNGFGDGQSHNIYIGRTQRMTAKFNSFHHAKVGHNLKSRARENYIAYNRFIDELDGTASYEINLPDGGLAFLIGNIIQQGPKTENETIVSYGEEGLQKGPHEFYFANNTVINDGPSDSKFIHIAKGVARVLVVNNLFSGPGKILDGIGELKNNMQVGKSHFVAPDEFNYQLIEKSNAIGAGIDPGKVRDINLLPSFQYVHPLRSAPRKTNQRLDLGALSR